MEIKKKYSLIFIAIILIMFDKNAFGTCFKGTLTGVDFGLNIISTVLLLISVVATIFSGIDYMKNGKDLLKD